MFQRITMSRRLLAVCLAGLIVALTGCAAATTTVAMGGTLTVTPGASPSATAGQTSPCLQLIPGVTLADGVPGVPGFQLPTDTYIRRSAPLGGGTGEYTVEAYGLCFQGQASQIVGTSGSAISNLIANGWVQNNLFPDPTSVAYLDPCSGDFTCVNTSGVPDPFTFVSVQTGYTVSIPGYTVFQLQVATIAAPACLNDPSYYVGTPQYTIFEDGPNTGGSNPTYHFQMPPGTRNSTFRGGGTAGSSYVYFCSAGTAASVTAFLQHSMQQDGYTPYGGIVSGCFEENKGTSPVFSVQVCVTNPNNYYLRIFVPQ